MSKVILLPVNRLSFEDLRKAFKKAKEESRHLPGKHNQQKHGTGGNGTQLAGTWTKKKTSETSTVWQSGEHKITNYAGGDGPYAVSDKYVERVVIKTVDDLQATNPVDGPIDVRIMPRLKVREFENSKEMKTVNGVNILGTGAIKLNGSVAGNKSIGVSNKNPASMGKDSLQTTLVHEWGHAIDRRETVTPKGSRYPSPKGIAPLKTVSKYGETNVFEAYAENFAEFYLSKGTTTNKAATDSAKEFGWKI
jgi:hypothetical protein